MSFAPEDISYVDIYPPIAVARVGDSKEWYLGPEVPGHEPIPEGGFKDANHKIKRVAARFRVYAFGHDGRVLGEIDGKTEYTLKWTVHVANKKSAWVLFRGQYKPETFTLRNKDVQGWPAGLPGPDADANYAYTDTRHNLIIDSGKVSVTGPSHHSVPLEGNFHGSFYDPTKVHLGDMLTDDHGRLLVLASNGLSWSLHSRSSAPEDQVSDDPTKPHQRDTFNNDDWVDSMCDGTVHLEIHSNTSKELKIEVKNRATIISAPPRFANGFHCPTTLLELVEDVYERQKRQIPGYDVGEVNYYRDIEPLFHRMYLNSWTNFRANEGHGPRKASLWLDNPDLYNPNPVNPKVRENIFARVRAPVKKNDPDNLALRDQQKNMYYMPRLGGNSGDMPENSEDERLRNEANRWASLTERQYDLLAKWSQGKFVTGERISPVAEFKDIDLQHQPAALTTAALEWSVGAPLYPGIECYWIAEFDHMYKLSDRFRFADTVNPGDLSKGLALPWQADFFMCNTHWWPSVRPDNIVTEEDFFKVTQDFAGEPQNVALNFTRRVRWDDGFDIRPDEPVWGECWGNSDMVRKWIKLGFIAQEQYGVDKMNKLSVYIEKERNPDFPHTDSTMVRGPKADV